MTQSNSQQDEIIKRINRELDEAVDELDPVIVSKLRSARQRALQQHGPKARVRRAGWVFAATAAMIVLVVFMVPTFESTTPQNGVGVLEDVRLLSSSDELELYEDLEFYHWLDASQQG